MRFIEKLISKYAIYCPYCNDELYWNASFKDTDILECKTCKLYFKYKGNKKQYK
ncbi:hypothetical protein KHQ81_00565 [Mycoplasmatota bacterium]|nr:hypothetical protein KHQ81_00565 [Mycoplasmatota bacterium]